MSTYIGLDVHSASTTLVAVDEKGKRIGHPVVVETKAKAIIDALLTLPQPRFVCLEEGTQSAWLYEVLSPHAQNVTVVARSERRDRNRCKDDARDALELAEMQRTDKIDKPVYKEQGKFKRLRALAAVYRVQVQDSTRTKNRIKAMFRSRGIAAKGAAVYEESERETWIAKLPAHMRGPAYLHYRAYDHIQQLKKAAHDEMLQEARSHRIVAQLCTVPGLGPIRSAQLVAIIVAPERFRTKRQLWKYAGFGIVTRTTGDWKPKPQGGFQRVQVQHTRGLNRDHSHTLKDIFNGAAGTVIQEQDPNCPLFQHYLALTQGKTRHSLAKLTIARQIAAITLAIWKENSRYDPANVRKHT
jgi:transposase